jgi:hypothetical protein
MELALEDASTVTAVSVGCVFVVSICCLTSKRLFARYWGKYAAGGTFQYVFAAVGLRRPVERGDKS